MSVIIPRGFTKRNFPVRKKRKPVRKLNKRVSALEASKERKIIDTQLTAQVSNTTPSLVELTNLAQGLTDTTRIGNKIMLSGLQFRYLAKDTVQNSVRVMIVQDKQTNGAIFAAADVLADVTAIDNVASLRNRDESLRFRVLYDRVHLISLTGKDSVYVSKFIKLNVPVKYDGNAGTIADITSNSLAILHVSEVASSNITGFWRVFFTDG